MPIRLSSFLTPELVKAPLAATTKQAAISELVDLIASAGCTHDRDRLLSAVMERESARTTGIGRGLAIPHAKTEACPKLVVAFGRTAAPIDFASIDGRPVRLIVLLAGPPDQTGMHIQILARLSRMVTNEAMLHELLQAPGPREVFEVIRQQDDALG